MVNDEVAAALLEAAAVTSGVTDLARTVVAPGPLTAQDCRQVVVWSDGPRQQNQPGQANTTVGLYGGCCASVTVWRYTVRFVADCVPAFDDNGRPPVAQDVTDWSLAYLRDVQRINEALYGTDLTGGGLAGWGYDCSNLLIGDGIPGGPNGGVAWTDWAVTFSPA